MNELTTICIYDPAGANYLLGKEWEFPITDKCERSAKIMGDDFVRLVFESTHKVVFDAFSFIRYNGQTFFLREKYIPKPKGTFKEDSGDVSTAYFSYDVKFVSVANMLDKYVCYRHVKVSGDNGGEWNEPEININGNLETMYKIIMGSIQQVAERLSDHMEFTSMLKTIPANGLNSDGTINTNNVKLTAGTKLLTFNFSGDKIANVCTTVANNFTNDDKKDTEWYITEDNGSLTLHFSKYVDEEYGVQYVSDYISNNNSADSSAHPQKSGGLKDVDYAQEWSGITNVIVPYGSTRNMTYQAAKGIDEVTQMQSTFGKRLRLKPNTYYYVQNKDGKDVSFLTDKQGAVRNNSVDTGIEEVRFYDEIYPQGHFRVTKVETKNKRQDGEIVPEYTVDGVAIDSNGNEIQPAEGFYPIAIEEGTTLSVRFEKGLLNGREFEIANKTRKDEGRTTYSLKFTIVADGSLEDGTLIPSGNFIPREGDEFALFNMKMPEVYITAAEKELAQRVYSDLEEAVSKRPEVKCTTDPTSWDKEIALGYQFQVKSEKFNSEDTFVSRVISYSYKLTKPKEIQFNLASAIMQGTLSSMSDQIADVTHQAGGLEQRAINLSRRGWRDAAEMAEMVDSLAADMMLVGNEKYQFAFTAGIEIVNSNNQTTAIKIGEGTLQHTQDPYISDYTCQGWWSHGAVTLNNGHTENGITSLVSLPDTPFYLYAVVGQNSDNISFELQDKEQDGEAYLLLGILSSAFTDTIDGVTTNYRVFNRTNGYSQISGGTITTEQMQDAGRNLIIDFQSNPPRIIARNGAEIVGNIKFLSAVDENGNDVLKTLESLGFDVSGLQNDVNNVKYVDISNATNISLAIRSQVMNLSDVAVKLASSRYKMKFQKGSEIVLSPFSTSCIAIVEKGQNVSHSTVIDLVKWGEEYTPTTEVDAYFLPADKEYFIEYAFPNQHDHIEYEMKEVWTTNNVQVLVESGDYLKMLQAEMSAKEESTMEAIAGLKDIQDSLQSQIDGEVTSWFYDKAPVDTSDNVLTDIEPMSEWLKNYTFENGVYTLKSGERNELVNHIGDTYTNMEDYKVDDQGNTTTPLAGLSWRWCDATTVNHLPSKYITIRYSQNGSVVGKKLHWHKIADSDAVKALQEAGKAQATADGKSTIFTTQPSNYSVGDMWILMEDTRVGGTLYQKGTVLNANNDSVVFNYAHWSEDVKYIDESVAAQKAQEALDDLELGGTNLLTGSRTGEGWSQYTSFADGVYYSENNTSGEKYIYSPKNLKLTKGTYTLSFDFKTDGFKKYSGTNNEGVQLFFLDGDFSPMNNHRIQYADISTNWKHYIWTFEVEEDCSGDAYIRFDNDRTSSYTNHTKLWVKDVKLEKGNKATGWSPAPEDVDSKVEAYGYLKEVLTDSKNTTDITGGLVMTNLLMLKDTANAGGEVNAGMSGVEADNILFWGGGTYDDAVAAKKSPNYYKSGTTPITTLLKKDGTGKIGIFKISETQAIVDVPNLGEVVIDAVNGVSVKDKSKVVKALVTPKTMSEAENDIKSVTFVNAKINVNNTYNLSTNGFGCSKVLWSNPSAPALSVINGTLRVTAKFKIDLSRQSADNHWIRMIVSLGGAYGFKGMTGSLYITSPMFYQGYFGGEDDRLMTLTANCTFTNAEAEMLDEIRVYATMYAEDKYHEIIDPTYSFEPNVEISAKIELTTDEKINNSQYSIMAKDGFLSMSGKKMFKVLNGSGGTQKIFAKGLSGAKGDTGSGELYISSDFIQAFRELCDVLEDFFPLARTIGSNATNAEQCVKKVQAVRNALKTTSIIASS